MILILFNVWKRPYQQRGPNSIAPTWLHWDGMEIIMQWISGLSDIPGNEKADTLAKQGSRQEQRHTETIYETVKQIIRSNYKEKWLKKWARNQLARLWSDTCQHNINKLNRKDRANIFCFITQYIPLNSHLNRIGANVYKSCPLCDHPNETTEQHLTVLHWKT